MWAWLLIIEAYQVALGAIIHGVAKSWTQLSMHTLFSGQRVQVGDGAAGTRGGQVRVILGVRERSGGRMLGLKERGGERPAAR